jgi:activator of HSP90 ATPase
MDKSTIQQTVTFSATPMEIYDLLMDGEKHAAFTGAAVLIDPVVNGKFDVFEGYCRGYNIELVPGKKIVQAWRFDEEGWPEDHYSTCTFLLERDPAGTKLSFTQTGVPSQHFDVLNEGWEEYYWEPLRLYLEEND